MSSRVPLQCRSQATETTLNSVTGTGSKAGLVAGKRVLLIIGGGIAAYKCLELIRLLRSHGAGVTPVLTRAAEKFVTPLSVTSLAAEQVHRNLFDSLEEARMGHIDLSRSADLIVLAPATADLLAKMSNGLADDLASTLLLATDTDIIAAPAMNVRMWLHAATQRNVAALKADGIRFAGPAEGEMACGEFGLGRMLEPEEILAHIETAFAEGPLSGKHVIVTAGPTREPIDPVRFISNRSSGRQGAAIARALLSAGASVTYVTGPAEEQAPEGADIVCVQTAQEMLEAVQSALPAEAAVFSAAVTDWRAREPKTGKIKKSGSGFGLNLEFVENPDILRTVGGMLHGRPRLVVGFAAETDNVMKNARAKLDSKGCDWIVANDVSPKQGVFGGPENKVALVTASGAENWPRMTKDQVAERLVEKMRNELLS